MCNEGAQRASLDNSFRTRDVDTCFSERKSFQMAGVEVWGGRMFYNIFRAFVEARALGLLAGESR